MVKREPEWDDAAKAELLALLNIMAEPERAKPEVMRAFKFDPFPTDGSVHWDTYEMTWDVTLTASGIEHPDDKKTLLLAKIGMENVQLLASLVVPGTIKTTNYDTMMGFLKAHLGSKESQVVALERFRNRTQGSDPVRVWVADLRRLASFCKMGEGFSGKCWPK